MRHVTFIEEQARTAPALVEGERVLVAPADLPAAIGWELKTEGLCRGDVCVPVRDRIDVDGLVDVAAVAGALGRPVVVDAAAGLVALALDRDGRRQALESGVAPPFVLPDLDGHPHELAEWDGRRKLLLAFSSW